MCSHVDKVWGDQRYQSPISSKLNRVNLDESTLSIQTSQSFNDFPKKKITGLRSLSVMR
jgi:hypothetical protein